ncbi:PBS lyase HEAT-like repeat protein [Calothrix sp. NIES-4071]|nr:PBS lyase HEAT-like repeat protein [Calothrix sp. NIES-4071]BAZ55374.1 PBS lyase HEAT-like repeat protein [Calothrix sp. NIES-4105]
MARVSLGPEAKKRACRLFEVLLAYANDALDCDELALNALQPNIQIRWLSETRLVIRTKVRFLQALTGLQTNQKPLNSEQIKESLRRLADFVEILEDNRSTRGGSENWHFTLNLWHHRHDTEANLQRFEQEWERRRSGKVTEAIEAIQEEKDSSNPWKDICKGMLQNQRRLTTNPLTSVDGMNFDLDAVYVPLGLVERKQRDRRREDILPTQGSRLYESEETEIMHFTLDSFLMQLASNNGQELHRVAIVGEPGAGKTTLLQKVACWILEESEDLPIWVTLADLQAKCLEDYLIQDWLRAAIRKRHVPQEVEEEFCEQFYQGRVWLLLDAVDEMPMESSYALSKIASFLTGWVGSANVILTCRLNVWDAGKNALSTFSTYRNLNFTYASNQSPNLVGQFIQRWFQDNPILGERLQTELEQPGRQRIKDAVKNPLRLALMCRTWALSQGEFPSTKATLYKQFVDAIYEWKQDRFGTTCLQRQQLNQALGELALQAIYKADTKFRLSHSFVCQVLGAPDEGLFQLALLLGWLNQVGISETQGEKVYAFYHPTFQEYFAALAIDDWRFFFDSVSRSYRIFEPQWREVILLWLGREDISGQTKDEFITALTQFDDKVGNYYSYQAYFLAAAGVAEFASSLSSEIITSLIKWRFGYPEPIENRWCRFPAPVQEGARVALLKTDRKCAITLLEEFLKTCPNEFETWSAAFSLGRTFDPGNKIAIATLEKLVTLIRLEPLRLQATDSLGKVDPGNKIAISVLTEIIESTEKDSIRRKGAYLLAKIDPENKTAFSIFETFAKSESSEMRRHVAENMRALVAENPSILSHIKSIPVLAHLLNSDTSKSKKQLPKSSQLRKPHKEVDITRLVAALENGIQLAQKEDIKVHKASKLALLDPDNQIAFDTLIELVKHGKSDNVRKHATENFKKVLCDDQIPKLIASIKDCFYNNVETRHVASLNMEQYRYCYKLIWYCAEKMTYLDFYQIWHS